MSSSPEGGDELAAALRFGEMFDAGCFEPSLVVWLNAAADVLERGCGLNESRRAQLIRALRAASAECSRLEAIRVYMGPGEKLSKWDALRLGVKATPKASRVARRHLTLVEPTDEATEAVVESRTVDTRVEFERFASELSDAAAVVSSTRRLMSHPAYLSILALGERAIPLILRRIESGDTQPVWLRLLAS